MTPKQPYTNLQFLSGGGEMGALTRAKDWTHTPIGNPETWPQSLRTTLGILLNSKFPMFLFWGAELICFYNNAYRPSLGNDGKHPGILGMRAEEGWPEIWTIIHPLIQQVQNDGEATWNEDALIPIYRNGKLEDVYWTFSYSPVKGESGKVDGVLVTCTETTSKIETLRKLEETKNQLRSIILHAPVAMCLFRTKEYIVETINERALELLGREEQEVLNRPVMEAMHELQSQGIKDLLDQVYATGETFSANELPLQILRNGKLETLYINFIYEALYNSDHQVDGIIAVGFEVNAQVEARKKIEDSEKRFRNTMMQAPVGITILKGPEFIVDMANETYLQIVDKKEEAFVGKSLFDSMPEAKDAVAPLLKQVLETGVPYYGSEFPVILNRFGKKETTYFNFVYHPLLEENEKPAGVIAVATEVTDLIKAKHALSETERQFRNLIIQSPVPMAILRGGSHVIELANTIMYTHVWQKKEADIAGKKLLDVFPELKDQKYPKLLKRVFDTGISHSEKESVAYVQHEDGLKKFYLDYEYAPLFDTDGKISGIIITVSDVTEKVDARIRLEDSEREYRDIAERLNIVIEASELGTWEWDLETDRIIYSDRYVEIFGSAFEDVENHERYLALVHPDDMAKRNEAINTALETGVLTYEIRIIHQDASIHWIEAKGKVFYAENERPVKLIGTVRDITTEKNRRQELLESELKFRLLADSMPQHIWTADTEGNLNYYNKSVFTYSGLDLEQINKDGWIQIVHPDDREENIQQWIKAVTTGADFLFEHRFRRNDGEYRWQLSRAIPQKDADGNIQMWVGTSTDIQEQKIFTTALEEKVRERTEELAQKNTELVNMNAELQSFAYVSSHDLQEPLRKIQTFASRILAKEMNSLSENGKDYFRRMQEAAFRMQTLIQDLLIYSRTSTSDRVFENINLNELVEEIKNNSREMIAENNVVIEVGKMVNAKVIVFQFRQLLENMIGNSIKFSKPGVAPYIFIESEIAKGSALDKGLLLPQKNYCHICICDNGIGFDPQYKDRIFEVFQRLHGKEEYSGTGIGLSIVKKIVENHNGIITATGELNKGTQFDIYLPV